ncbi:hypothetical protein [Amycolatopsis sp. cmx-8-4]|uniref:hypothetical protein n=1 Tax=Amycolatopsis sp. cmx-8-4 TaxID=2790947 RepID=UPI00397D12B3
MVVALATPRLSDIVDALSRIVSFELNKRKRVLDDGVIGLRPCGSHRNGLKGSRSANLGSLLVLELTVKIELPSGLPVWVVVVVLVMPTSTCFLLRVINRVFPDPADQRMVWWSAFWLQRAEAKAARRRWRAQVRRTRREHRKARRLERAAARKWEPHREVSEAARRDRDDHPPC